MKATKWRPALKVTPDGKGVASQVGTRLLAEMADNSGLTDALSKALAPMCKRRRRHDPGRVLVDLAVTIAGGGDALSNLVTLRHQPEVFGTVASVPTAFRVVDAIDDQLLAAIRQARAKVRQGVWAAGLNPVTEHGYVTLDFDATLLDAHSDKEQAAPTYRKGYGFHPLGCWLDNTQEALAAMLRPGNAGANTSEDHVAVLDAALAQLPVIPRGQDLVNGVPMLARADSAGASHGFLDTLRRRGLEFSVGLDITEAVRLAILDVAADAWVDAVNQDYELREGAGVAEITDLLDLTAWPVGTRAICRREEPHSGAHFTLFDPEGWRYQVFMTDSTDDDLPYLEARHRGHARVEDRIRCAKDTGLRNLPFYEYTNNAVWVELVLIAQDLLAWTQGLCLKGKLGRAEPKALRYMLLHVAGRLVRGGGVVNLRIQGDWPWAGDLSRAFATLRGLVFAT
ncbi:MAG: IS1380-like element ISMsm3 family transposase [Actinomycetota bacterium]